MATFKKIILFSYLIFQSNFIFAENTANECEARVFLPAKIEAEDQTYTIKAETKKYITIPAEYKWVEKNLVLQKKRVEYKLIPAKYKVVDSKVQIRPPEKRYLRLPAEYNQALEKILITPEKEVWQLSPSATRNLSSIESDISVMTRTPAKYKYINRYFQEVPERIEVETIPARTITVKRTIVEKPAQLKKVVIPAVIEKIKVQELVKEAQYIEMDLPAVTTNIKKESIVEPIKAVVQKIVCKEDLTADLVERVQRSLSYQNHYKGEINGRLNKSTLDSILKFQKEKGLATGALTLETLQMLQVSVHN